MHGSNLPEPVSKYGPSLIKQLFDAAVPGNGLKAPQGRIGGLVGYRVTEQYEWRSG